MIREPGACFRGDAAALGQLLAGELDKGDRMKVFAALVKNAKPVRRRVVGYFFLLAASMSLAGCEAATNIMGKQGTGVAEVANQSPQEAASNLASLTDVILRNPASAEAYNTRGVAYARIGKFQEAIADFSQSIKLAPGNAASLTNRALAYRQINRDDAALADFNGAVAADPNHAPAYLGRANLLRVQGKLDEARADLDQAIKLNPENAQAFHARGLIYQRALTFDPNGQIAKEGVARIGRV